MSSLITTAGDLIKLALKDCGVIGVGQTPLAEDTNDALMRLNAMIGQWNRRRWLVYHLVDLVNTSTGAQSYTVGPAGDFAVSARPDQIEAAFARQIVSATSPNQIDYPLQWIPSRESYNQIALKQLQSFPSYFFYDAAYPLGRVYFYPVPQNVFELHITIKDTLAAFPSLTTQINLPAEYHEALLYNLGARLRVAYQLPPDPSIVALATSSLNTIRNANAQVGILNMPKGLQPGGAHYNIYSDQVY